MLAANAAPRTTGAEGCASLLGWHGCDFGLCGDAGAVAGADGLPKAEVGMKEECGAGVSLAFAEIIDPNAVALPGLVYVHPKAFVYVGQQAAANFHIMIQVSVEIDELPGCLVDFQGSCHGVEEIFLQIFGMEVGIAA